MSNPLPEFIQPQLGQRKPEYLAWTSLCVAFKVESYVELGSGAGHFIYRAGVPNVISIDIAHLLGIALHNPYQEPGVRYHMGDSHDPAVLAAVIEHLGGPPEAVFIDADHEYAPVKADFELWYPHATKLVAFHDILIPEVSRFWNEICLTHSSVELIARDLESAVSWQGPGTPQDGRMTAGGIGVIFK